MMVDKMEMSDEMTFYVTFDVVPSLKDAAQGSVVNIPVRVVEKTDEGAMIEPVASPEETKPELTPETASKMSAAELEKELPKAEEV